MQFDELAHDGEAEALPAVLAVGAGVGLAEAVEVENHQVNGGERQSLDGFEAAARFAEADARQRALRGRDHPPHGRRIVND